MLQTFSLHNFPKSTLFPNNLSPACIFKLFKDKISFLLIFGEKSPEKYYSGWFLVLMIGNLETWVGKIPARYKIYVLCM